jgi:hypothetical protein
MRRREGSCALGNRQNREAPDHATGPLLQAEGDVVADVSPFHRLCDRYDHHDAVLNAGHVRAVQRLGRRFGPV